LGENSFGYVWKPKFQMNECFTWIQKVFLTLILIEIMWICVIFMNMYLIGCYLTVDIWDKTLSSNIVKAWIQEWVNVAWCRESNNKRDYHRSWRRLNWAFIYESLEVLGNHGGWVMVFFGSLVLSVFYYLFMLDLQFLLCMFRAMPLSFWCCIVVVFHYLLLVYFLTFLLLFWVLGICWERGKLMDLG